MGVPSAEQIPVYAARLPPADVLVPYLRQIDASGRYTNRGPLVGLLEARMASALGVSSGTVTLAASGTAALQAAILAAAGRARPGREQALVPGYTFVATAHAAQACGYEVSFVDVSATNWAMDPIALRDTPDLDCVGVVIPVAPYGAAFDHSGWTTFQSATGIPVVIDAAASFEAIARCPACITAHVPVALSLHATKTFTTGEGGAVLWRDPTGLQRVSEALGFGFKGDERREVSGPGLNGRLSEYHAAIGLACLDAMDRIEAERIRLRDAYKAAAASVGLDEAYLACWPDTGSNYCLIEASTFEAAEHVIEAFIAAGVGSRRWYGRGLHRESFFSTGRRVASLRNTESVADRVLGIPVFPGMRAEQMDRVMRVLAECEFNTGPHHLGRFRQHAHQ